MFVCSGYMSLKNAMRGLFSEKSDVFSFGVLLLKIVSGRRNTGICDEEQFLGLVGLVNLTYTIHNIRKFSQFLSSTLVIFQAWKLWNNDNSMALVDPATWDPCFQIDILKCIHVGLLRVQELARDRPNVSTIISISHIPARDNFIRMVSLNILLIL